jgi:hypothetical protein
MTRKEMGVLIGLALVAWHVASIIADAERCKRNLDRFAATPTVPNFIKLAVAEGALIADLRWL